jgi:hypothetical protein
MIDQHNLFNGVLTNVTLLILPYTCIVYLIQTTPMTVSRMPRNTTGTVMAIANISSSSAI